MTERSTALILDYYEAEDDQFCANFNNFFGLPSIRSTVRRYRAGSVLSENVFFDLLHPVTKEKCEHESKKKCLEAIAYFLYEIWLTDEENPFSAAEVEKFISEAKFKYLEPKREGK